MNSFIAFFHHLFDPHCPDCKESLACASCETLRQQLEIANQEKKELLDRLIKPEPQPIIEPNNEYRPKHIPWSVRRQMIEGEDRKKASILREKEKELAQMKNQDKELNDLENEVLSAS
jgi:hypothetical protein